jgi:hypothetical protein
MPARTAHAMLTRPCASKSTISCTPPPHEAHRHDALIARVPARLGPRGIERGRARACARRHRPTRTISVVPANRANGHDVTVSPRVGEEQSLRPRKRRFVTIGGVSRHKRVRTENGSVNSDCAKMRVPSANCDVASSELRRERRVSEMPPARTCARYTPPHPRRHSPPAAPCCRSPNAADRQTTACRPPARRGAPRIVLSATCGPHHARARYRPVHAANREMRIKRVAERHPKGAPSVVIEAKRNGVRGHPSTKRRIPCPSPRAAICAMSMAP